MKEIKTVAKKNQECESCLVVGEKSEAVTIRNGEHVCQDCADEIDYREKQEKGLREVEKEAKRG
jgi:hypothetical protein